MRRTLALVAVLALCVASWLRHVIGAPYDPHVGWNSDLTLQYQHLQHWLFGRLATGSLPAWNPYQLAGIPAIATLQGGLYYPGHLFALVLPTPTALAAEILLHLAIGGVGIAAVALRVGVGPAAAIVAAAIFVLRGQFLASFGFVTALEAAAWLPVLLAGALDLADGRHRRGVVVCATAAGLSLLAGNTQSTVYLVYVAAAFLAARLASLRARPSAWGSSGVLFAAALALGMLLAAAQLLPTAELLAQGTRTARALPVASMFQFGVVPRTPRDLFLGKPIGGELAAVGMVPLLLAAAGLASRRRWLVGWALVVVVASVGLTLGRKTPVFDVVRELPALSWFRPKELALPMTQAAVALLAALGVETLLGGTAARARTARRLLVAALLAAGVAELATTPVPPSKYRFDAREDADVAFYGPTFAEAAALAGSGRIWVAGGSLQARLATKLASRHGVRAIDDYEPLNLRRQAEYVRYLLAETLDVTIWQGIVPPGGVRGARPMSERRRLLDALALAIVVVPPGDISKARENVLQPAGFRRVRRSSQGLELWENPATLPRAFTVHRVLAAPAAETLLPLLASPDFDPLAASYVEGVVPDAPAPGAPARGRPATIVVDGEREVVVEATLDAPGFLVLADTAYPGWRAVADGRELPIRTTNHLFRGVALPAGTHRVRFGYAPWTIPTGIAGSVLGVIVLLALAWCGRRR